MNKAAFDKGIFALIISLGPMSTTMWNKPLLIFIFLLSGLLLASTYLSDKGIVLSSSQVIVIALYFSIFAIGFISLMLTAAQPFGMVIDTNTFGRVFTVCVLLLLLISGLSYMNSLDDLKFIELRSLFLIPGLIFVFFGIYQGVCHFTGVSFFIDTRDWMHGVPVQIRSVLPRRLTSIAEEPSFLAPILVEFLILCVFLMFQKWEKYLLIVISLSLLLMTFSGGAYVNTLLISLLILFLVFCKFPFGKLHFIVLFGGGTSVLLFMTYGQVFLEFALNKFVNEAFGGSSRSQFMSNLTSLIFESNPFNMMFGHGLTSLSFLSDFGMQTEDVLFRISNNMFVDIVWESGFIGGGIAVIVYGILFSKSIKIQIQKKSALSLSLVLVSQSFITGFYRSEYISTHIIWVFILIFWAFRYEKLSLVKDKKQLVLKEGYE